MSSSASTVPTNPVDILPFPQKPISPSSLAPSLAGSNTHLNHQSQQQQQQNQQSQQQQHQQHLSQQHIPQQQPTPPSTTAAGTPVNTQAPTHKRTYQACIPCRLRKVRCDLGSVEAPHEPPCVRCRRESKDCYFSATRRKSRVGNLSPASTRGRGGSLLARGVRRSSEVDSIDPAYDREDSESTSGVTPSSSTISYGGVRKRQRIDSTASSEGPQEAAHGYTYPVVRDYDDPKLRSPHNQSSSHFDRHHEDAQTNTTASTLLHREVYNSHDALQLLFEAVGASTPVSTGLNHDGSDGKTASIDGGDARRGSRADSEPRIIFPGDHDHQGLHSNSNLDPGNMGPSPRRQYLHQIHRNTPLSPLASREHGRIQHPLGNLPKLAEHASLMGRATTNMSNGRNSDYDRAIKAWENSQFVRDGWFTAREAIGYIEYFLDHMQPLSPILSSPPELSQHPDLLTTEPFLMTTIITIASRYKTLDGQGGLSRSYYIHEMLWKELKRGFERLLWGGAPAPQTQERSGKNGKEGKGLRTIGTVEALIVLTEWHVRSAHFPMEVGGDTWGIATPVADDDYGRRRPSMFGVGRNGEKIGDMLEPVRRSDTMSWMLLGNALSLSYELGVFDEDSATGEDDAYYRIRCKRVQRKLLVYIMQLASRLGFTPMVPMEICNLESYRFLRLKTSTWTTKAEMNDVVYDYWAELSLLMKKGASLLFPSRAGTKEIIKKGTYGELLRSCLPEMKDWKDRFERLGLPTPIHNILTLEYEHVRIFHNSLALQAVVERCTSSSSANPKQPPSHSFAALMQMYSGDVEFINELVDAARCMLTTVVEKMMPNNELRHAPVRIYLRILSAAMFLLKTFALGAKEDDITVSLELMHNTTEALRAAAVDDVHLAWRFADLLETLTKRIQRRFVRMQRNGAETPIPGHHQNGANTPQPQTPMANTHLQQQQQHPQHHRPMDLSKLIDPIHPSSTNPSSMTIPSLASPNPGMHPHHMMPYSHPNTPGSQAHVDFFYSPNEPAFDDWLAIPIDPILDAQYGDKNNNLYQNGLGIGVGLGVEVDGRGVDLLDVLLGMGEG